jgi:hypothetical protein
VKPPSEIWLETTSAGPMGEFFKRYTDAMKRIGRYWAIFVPWTVQAEYTEDGDFIPNGEPEEEGELSEVEYQELYKLTDGQMLWRRSKIHELGIDRQIPAGIPHRRHRSVRRGRHRCVHPPAMVLRARKRKMEDPDAPLIIGVDPGRQRRRPVRGCLPPRRQDFGRDPPPKARAR